jgi:hypothetical protein
MKYTLAAAFAMLLGVAGSTALSLPQTPTGSVFPQACNVTVTVYEDPITGAPTFVPGTDNVARCTVSVNRALNVTGWDYVHVTPEASLLAQRPEKAYYFCGYAEGFLTYQDIYNVLGGGISGFGTTPEMLVWIEQNILYLQNIAAQPEPYTPDGIVSPKTAKAVKRFIQQLQGLADGVTAAVGTAQNGQPTYNLTDMFILNYNPELMDIMIATQPTAEATQKAVELAYSKRTNQHCSAMIKMTNDDIYFTHDTWSEFSSMYRQYKTYDFEVSVSFSSYPGSISSVDDFYHISNGMAVMETTNTQANTTLTQLYVLPNTIPEFMRVMAANVWASSAPEWSTIFLDNNSGTYCNQYMVLDMNLVPAPVTPSTVLPPNTFWVIEQLPGPYSVAADQTALLNAQRYWGSYNIPFYKQVNVMSLAAQECDVFGSEFCYNTYARALMFKRANATIQTLDDVKRTMRWNEWETDPLSVLPDCVGCNPKSNAQLAIACRADLVPINAQFGSYNNVSLPMFGALSGSYMAGTFGAIDNKISSYNMMMSHTDYQEAVVVSGPTHDTQPVFCWSKLNPELNQGLIYLGQPDCFDFDYVTVKQHKIRPNVPSQTYTQVCPANVPVPPTPVPSTPATPAPSGNGTTTQDDQKWHSFAVGIAIAVGFTLFLTLVVAVQVSRMRAAVEKLGTEGTQSLIH